MKATPRSLRPIFSAFGILAAFLPAALSGAPTVLSLVGSSQINGQQSWTYSAGTGLRSSEVKGEPGGLFRVASDGGILPASPRHFYTRAGLNSNPKMNNWLARPVNLEGTTYVRFLVRLESRDAGSIDTDPNEFVFGFAPGVASGGFPPAFAALKIPFSGDEAGVEMAAPGGAVFYPDARVALNETIFVVARFNVNASGNLTGIDVWLDPESGDAATPDHSTVYEVPGPLVIGATDGVTLGNASFRYRAQNMPSRVDNLALGTSWADVVPAAYTGPTPRPPVVLAAPNDVLGIIGEVWTARAVTVASASAAAVVTAGERETVAIYLVDPGAPITGYQWLLNNAVSIPGGNAAEFSFMLDSTTGTGTPVRLALGSILKVRAASASGNVETANARLAEPPPTDIILWEWQPVETVTWGTRDAFWGGSPRLQRDFHEGYLHLRPNEDSYGDSVWTELPKNMTAGQFTLTFDLYINGPKGIRTDVSIDVVGDHDDFSGPGSIRPDGNAIGTTGSSSQQPLRHTSFSSPTAIPGAETQEQWYHVWILYDIGTQRMHFYYAPFGSQPLNTVPAASWDFGWRNPGETFRYFVIGLRRPENPGLRLGNLYFSEGKLLTLSPTAGTFTPFVPAYAAQPVDTAATPGSSAQISADLVDPSLWNLRWQISFDNGSSFSEISESSTFTGTATPALTVHDVSTLFDGLVFRLKATADDGEIQYSNAVVLTVVTAPPVITFSTADRIVPSGDAIVLSANIDGGPAATIRWQRSVNGGGTFANLTDAPPFSGVFGPSLTIGPADLGLDGHIFRVVATNDAGTTISGGARLTVLPPPTPPVILTHPEDRSVRYNHPTAFEVTVEAYPPATLRWQISMDGGASFSNLSEDTLGIFTGTGTPHLVVDPAIAFVDGIQLRARAHNALGIVFSNAAHLNLRAYPTLAEWAADIGLPAGASAPDQRHGALGMTTIEAFAFDLKPTTTAMFQLPTLHRSDGELRLQFRRNLAVHGLSFLIETSSDLKIWEVAEVEERFLYNAKENVEVREVVFPENGENRFLRLRLEVNE